MTESKEKLTLGPNYTDRFLSHCWIPLNFGSFRFIPSSTPWCGKMALISLRSFSTKKRNSPEHQRHPVRNRRFCLDRFGERLQHGFRHFYRDPGKPGKEIVDPGALSRFSNSALTGTRVPRNTQAPLTRSGSRSTEGQEDQSSMVKG